MLNEQPSKRFLRDYVKVALKDYFSQLEGATVSDLYVMVISEVEHPLLETVMIEVDWNQSKAAKMLGINRGTLCKLLEKYNLSVTS